MISKIFVRVGNAGTRCVRRIARSSVASPNAQLGWKKCFVQQANQTRSFTVLSVPSSFNTLPALNTQILSVADPSTVGRRNLQTKGDKELVEFLDDEISAEKKSHKKLPSMSPFEASFNDAEVILTKKAGNETIIIKFNVNNSVDTDEVSDVESREAEQTQMNSRPNFTVEIERGGKVLSLACSFSEYEEEQPQQEETFADLFTVNELSVYEGDFSETTYSTAGDILDGNLYDLLMNMLEDRGITSEFVQKISDFSTVYEHQRYVSLLENLKKFFN